MKQDNKVFTTRLLMVFMALFTLVACDEQSPETYHAPDGIYFNNRTAGVVVDSTQVSFVYEADEVEYLDIPVVVQTLGMQADAPREIALQVLSLDAVQGVDYELVTPAVMPAHESSFNYIVRLKRTAALQSQQKSITLQLSSNAYFSTLLSTEETGDSEHPLVSLLTYRIDFSDFYSVAPAGWRKEYVGEFSERKLRLMWKLFDDVVGRADYNVAGGIPFNKWVYMQNELDTYMMEQYIILDSGVGEVDVDALVNPDAQGDERQLLDFTPITE